MPSPACLGHVEQTGRQWLGGAVKTEANCTATIGGLKNWPLWIAALLPIVLLSACSRKSTVEAPESEPVVTVEIAVTQSATIERKITSDAVLFPLRQAAIVPKISAPVAKFYVERGSRVTAGQLLAELENRDLAGALAESQGSYEQAQAAYENTVRGAVPEEQQKAELDVQGAKQSVDALQKVYESRQALFKDGAISGKEVDEALVSLTQARNQMDIAQKHLQSLQDRKSTRLNSSHIQKSRMPSSA